MSFHLFVPNERTIKYYAQIGRNKNVKLLKINYISVYLQNYVTPKVNSRKFPKVLLLNILGRLKMGLWQNPCHRGRRNVSESWVINHLSPGYMS